MLRGLVGARAWVRGGATSSWRCGRGAAGLFIATEATPNENALKFLPEGTEVLGGRETKQFSHVAETGPSPLAQELFEIPGVRSLMLGPDFIAINKDEYEEWPTLKPRIFAVLSDFFEKERPVLLVEDTPAEEEGEAPTSSHGSEAPAGTGEGSAKELLRGFPDPDEEVVTLIKEMLDTRVRPRVQDDGGDVEYIGFVDGVVLVKLQGACVGCGSSDITLKNGIERLMQYYIPEVAAVMAVGEEDMNDSSVQAFLQAEREIAERKAAAAQKELKEE